MSRPAGQEIADALNDDRDQHKGDHAGPHDVILHLGIAIVVTECADASPADGADDGRQADQRDQGDRRGADDARHALAQIDTEHDLQRGEPHRLARFDQAAVHFGDRLFDLPGEEGDRPDDQREERAAQADRGPGYELGDIAQDHDEDDEGDGAEEIDDLPQHRINDLVFQARISI